MSRKLATLEQLQTVYGLRDLYDLVEIAIVDSHNDWVAAQPRKG